MKKVLVTVVLFICLLVNTTTVHAADNEDGLKILNGNIHLEYPDDPIDFESAVQIARNQSIKNHSDGKDKVYVVLSTKHNKSWRLYLFDSLSSPEYIGLSNVIDEDVDFAQVGQFISTDELDSLKEAFQADSAKAAIHTIFPVYSTVVDNSKNLSSLYDQVTYHNLPIYSKITLIDSETFLCDIAIGKYVIQKGDNLVKKLHTIIEI